MKSLTRPLLILACGVSLPALAFAEDAVDYKNATLTGDWGGARDRLAEAGVGIEAAYKFDVMGNAAGGIKEGVSALDNLDVIFNFNGEKLLGSHGTTALVHLLNNNGGKPDAHLAGSAQGIDNIEVPEAAAKLYQAWIQQNFLEDKFSVLAGLYDLNSEFYVNEPSGIFLHSTYGIGTEISQSGQNRPSIYPFTSPGIRVKMQPTRNSYVEAVMLDGVPGDPGHLRGTHIALHSGDGALVVAEAGYTSGSKVAVGAWYYTEKFPDQIDVDSFGNPVQKRSDGTYLIGDTKLYREQGSDASQGLAAFARIGFAEGDVNPCDYAWSAGLVYTGLIPDRDEGQLGLGINGAHNSGKFRQATIAGGTPVDNAETAIELTYSDTITPWLAVQPDIQYIMNPGTDPALDNALVFGARFTLTF